MGRNLDLFNIRSIICSTEIYIYISCFISEKIRGNSGISWVIHLNCVRLLASLLWVFPDLLAIWNFLTNMVNCFCFLVRSKFILRVLSERDWEGHSAVVLNQEWLCPPRDIWQYEGALRVVTAREGGWWYWHLVRRDQGWLLSICQCTGQSPQQICLPPHVSGATVEECCHRERENGLVFITSLPLSSLLRTSQGKRH